MATLPPIVIDTREQLPYRFADVETVVRRALPAGDYSLDGCEDRVAVERKSLADAYGSVGRGRRRFENEFKRLSAYDYAAVVVEATLEDFVDYPPTRSAVHPKSAVHTLLGWSVKYGVHVHFAGSRRFASALTLHLLRHWWRYNGTEKNRTVGRLGGRAVKQKTKSHEQDTRKQSTAQAISV